MSPRSKREYLEAIFLRYKGASRQDKTAILDEFCAVSGYHRKHAIRLLRRFRRFQKPKQSKRGRSSLYDHKALLKPLKRIWLASNLPCSKRLKALMPLWLAGYIDHYGPLPPETLAALVQISPATIDRLLCPVRVQYRKRGRATTKPGTLLKKHPHQHQPMGSISSRFSRSRYRRPLWTIPVWDVCLHH